VPVIVGWLLRIGAAALAAWLLVPAEMRAAIWWLDYAFAAAVLVMGVVWEHLARRFPGGAAPLGMAIALFAAAFILIHAHTAKFTDVATFAFAGLFGIAIAAQLRPADVGSAIPGAAVLLAGLLLSGMHETYSNVPQISFILTGLAPLALLPLAIPALGRLRPHRQLLLALLLLIIPLGIAIFRAMQVEEPAW
jgi:hypothetical protein